MTEKYPGMEALVNDLVEDAMNTDADDEGGLKDKFRETITRHLAIKDEDDDDDEDEEWD